MTPDTYCDGRRVFAGDMKHNQIFVAYNVRYAVAVVSNLKIEDGVVIECSYLYITGLANLFL